MIFTKNASEALNLVANTLAWTGDLQVGPGDEVVITEMEHHSNIVPWQLLTERTGATLRWFGLTDDGRLDLSRHRRADQRAHQGRLPDLGVEHARHDQPGRRDRGARRTRSARSSSSTPRRRYRRCRSTWSRRARTSLAFTGHKVVGPTGIGVLWGRRDVLEQLPPFLGGGEMIHTVTMERSTYADIPHKFEAGTPPIVEAVGLGAAVDYLGHVGHGQRSARTRRPSPATCSTASASVSGVTRARPAATPTTAAER